MFKNVQIIVEKRGVACYSRVYGSVKIYKTGLPSRKSCSQVFFRLLDFATASNIQKFFQAERNSAHARIKKALAEGKAFYQPLQALK